MSLHNLIIAIHTIAGVTAFFAGFLLLLPAEPAGNEPRLFRIYQSGIFIMAVGLVVVVAVDWTDLSNGSRLAYGDLLVLAGYMSWRAWSAGRSRGSAADGKRSIFIDDVGFTLIALFDGFAIVGAIDLGAPGWLVGAVAIIGVAAGISAVNRVKGRDAAAV